MFDILPDEFTDVDLLEWNNGRLLEECGRLVVVFVVSERVESTLIVPAEKRVAAADDHLNIKLAQSLRIDACRKAGLIVSIAYQHELPLI
jgi:hypothetical protein